MQRIDIANASLSRAWTLVLFIIWLHILWLLALSWQGKLLALVFGGGSFYLAVRWLNAKLLQNTHLFIKQQQAHFYNHDQHSMGTIGRSSFVLGDLMWLTMTSNNHFIILKDSVSEADWRLLARVLNGALNQ